MSDAGGQQQISEEELQAYLSQLREAPLTDVVAQTVSVLLNAAQVKLGRPDGRALIDIVAAIRDTAGDRLDQRLTQELDNALTQLRMAQVEAEKDAPGSEDAAPGTASEPGHEGLGQQPAAGPQQQQQQQGDASSRLWIPGQG